jgi:ribosomal protein L7/L12
MNTTYLRELLDAFDSTQVPDQQQAIKSLIASEVSLSFHCIVLEECQKLREGKKILAIKLYRARTGKGLKEAKDAIESFEPFIAKMAEQ